MKNDKEENESKYKVEYLGEKYTQDLLIYKVIILGLYGVGKTTIIHRLGNREFDKEYFPTISVDVKTFQVKLNDKIVQIQIWDCCGNDEYAQNTKNLFINASIAILVYAINDKKSFKDIEKWYNLVKQFSFDSIIFLIGNKSDLKEERKVTIEEVEKSKKDYDNIKIFFETSAKNGENIDKLLENIAISIYKKNEKEEKDLENAMNHDYRSIKLNLKNHKKRRKKECIC